VTARFPETLASTNHPHDDSTQKNVIREYNRCCSVLLREPEGLVLASGAIKSRRQCDDSRNSLTYKQPRMELDPTLNCCLLLVECVVAWQEGRLTAFSPEVSLCGIQVVREVAGSARASVAPTNTKTLSRHTLRTQKLLTVTKKF
jgi:hypothetical protein